MGLALFIVERESLWLHLLVMHDGKYRRSLGAQEDRIDREKDLETRGWNTEVVVV